MLNISFVAVAKKLWLYLYYFEPVETYINIFPVFKELELEV